MLGIALGLLLAQSSLKVSVLDVSAPDAIYEDVSRALAQRVSDELLKLGYLARRADESELPVEGCRLGPCLAQIAKTQGADILLLLDATEADNGKVEVALSAMRGNDGLPLAVGKWPTTAQGKPDKKLKKFFDALQKAVTKHLPKQN